MSHAKSQHQTPSAGLLALVDELLLSIIDQIDSHAALCNLSATCSRFQALVEPYVWRKLFITHGDHARDIAFALDRREARPSYVNQLSVRYRYDRSSGIEELNHFVGLMERLRSLTIESPCPNNTEFARSTYFDEATKINYGALLQASVNPPPGLPLALPMLQSLTIHGHGPEDEKFTFGRLVVMFLHPTLRHITLSCTNFDASTIPASVATMTNSTPLQTLTLIECNVNVKFLNIVLSLPKALKELDIGERQHVFPECYPSHDVTTRTSHPLFLDALAQQAGSLQRLAHTSGHTGYMSHYPPDEASTGRLRNLIHLQHLELGIESVLCACLERDDFPASLQTLKITESAWMNRIYNTEQILRHPGTVLRRCNELVAKMSRPVDLDVRFNNSDIEIILGTIAAGNINAAVLPSILGGPVREPVYRLASTLKVRNKRLRLFSFHFSGGNSFIPPYMYGEEVPHEELFYHSDDYWRLAGRNYKVLDDDEYIAELAKEGGLLECVECRKAHRPCFNAGDGKPCISCETVQECVYE